MSAASPHLIEGRVKDAAGAPIPMASVYFLEGPVALPDVAALTGPDGTFRLSAPVAGAYRLGIRRDGYAPAAAAVRPDRGQATVRVEIVLVPE